MRVLTEGMSDWRKVIDERAAAFIVQRQARGDRFISIEEVAERLDCPVKAVRRGWRAERYPFIIGDGDRKLVASEDGLERWIAARTKRQSLR